MFFLVFFYRVVVVASGDCVCLLYLLSFCFCFCFCFACYLFFPFNLTKSVFFLPPIYVL